VGDGDWLTEQRLLARTDAPFIRYRVDVHRTRAGPSTSLPLPAYLWRLARDRRHVESVELVLYDEHAREGDRPLVLVPVPVDAAVGDCEESGYVSAKGVPRPGSGMIFKLDGCEVGSAGPAWRPTLLLGRFRLRGTGR
jgi:hypothetical protein